MVNRTLASEGRALSEYWQLQQSPAFRGEGLPKGDGQLVLVIPGLFGNDFYLQPLRSWLRRMGYKTAMSMVGLNAGCPKRLLDRLAENFIGTYQRHAGAVAIIGHSRGGMLGKALIHRLAGEVNCFIALGSPVGAMLELGAAGVAQLDPTKSLGKMGSSSVVNAGAAAMRLLDPDCNSPHCACEYWDALLAKFPPTTQVTSIYSSEDPVVPPESCPIAGANNIEIKGSHGGLVVNAQAYSHIAAALGQM